ncbi:ABC transporter substrate-binding protein [Bradyrhizobium arachidis]|uniref:ABC transporter substrate-binding protein n=1 Tax=Bradyrhizobium arachidis TaxID=858423 RepID=UPI0021620587|nr:ABC transporter substrate-binding protein [Bradyrhizobium arachidis]UVO31012.1 ABC transporter substrate-binding protein [Bradyrhizobium arachidis]
MKRRTFIGAMASGALTPWLAASAQPASRKKLVGMVSSFSARQIEPLRAALLEKLRDLGWREGDNLEFDLRLAEPTPSALSAASAALVARAPDLLIAQGNPTLDAMRPHSGAIPVVFLLVADPVELGLVVSLSHPGGSLTGFTNFETAVGGKWVDLLKDADTTIERIVLIANPDNSTSAPLARRIERDGRESGVSVQTVDVRDADGIERAIRGAAGSPRAGLMTLPDSLPILHQDLIIRLTSELRIPSIHPFRTFAANGALMSYGLDFPELYRQAASYADQILRGRSPADLPVQAPTKFELVINLNTAKLLGIEIPPALLASADETIE